MLRQSSSRISLSLKVSPDVFRVTFPIGSLVRGSNAFGFSGVSWRNSESDECAAVTIALPLRFPTERTLHPISQGEIAWLPNSKEPLLKQRLYLLLKPCSQSSPLVLFASQCAASLFNSKGPAGRQGPAQGYPCKASLRFSLIPLPNRRVPLSLKPRDYLTPIDALAFLVACWLAQLQDRVCDSTRRFVGPLRFSRHGCQLSLRGAFPASP
jgi:hypothetical protein